MRKLYAMESPDIRFYDEGRAKLSNGIANISLDPIFIEAIESDVGYNVYLSPEAKNQNPIEQLTIYALALSRKLNLPLYYFKCAWFDESSYYEFFPLHAVYEKR